jgi:hypothetical protein
MDEAMTRPHNDQQSLIPYTPDRMPTLIAPFALMRVAALPYRDLVALAPSQTIASLSTVLTAHTHMEAVRSQVTDNLHHVIPSAAPHLRRLLINLKRDVHNARPPRLTSQELGALSAQLPPSTRHYLTTWLRACRAASAAFDAAGVHFEHEVPAMLRQLHGLARQEALLQPLALAAPLLFERLMGPPPTPSSTATKFERSLLSYVIRATAKTSPFSTFMHHALLALDPQSCAALPVLHLRDRTSCAYLNRGILACLHLSRARAAELVDMPLRLNPSLTWLPEGRVAFVASDYTLFARRLWRTERAARLRLHPTLARRLETLPTRLTWPELLESLMACGLQEEAARTLGTRLIESQVLLTRHCFDGLEVEPAAAFIAAASHTAAREAGGYAALARASDLARQFATAAAPARAGRLTAVRRLLAQAWDSLGTGPHPELDNVVLEDGFFSTCYGPVGGIVTELVSEVAAVLKPHVVEKPAYRELRQYFIRHCGRGGTCHDLVTFLRSAAFEICAAGWQPGGAGSEAPPATPRRIPLPVGVFVQFAAPESGVPSPHMLAIINQLHTGCGALSARYAAGQAPFHQALQNHLRDWIHTVTAPREPVDLLICGECNPLQAHPRVTDRVLLWPGEPCYGATPLLASDVVVRHDEASNLLQLYDRHGVAIAPVYLGATVLGPASGPLYWLTVLGQPYEIARPHSTIAPPADPVDVAYYPRRVVGRVVLQRAVWWMPAKRLADVWFRRTGVAQLLDVASDCQRLGMPRFVFARPPVQPHRPGAVGEHKPQWIDTRNPLCLSLLEHMIANQEWLALAEAMPDAHTAWPSIEGVPYATEFFVELAL